MQERRKETRRPAFWDAKIGFSGRQFRVNCMVQNISRGGARLALRQAADLPPEFILTIPRKQKQLEYRVRTRWRERRSMGVEILRLPERAPLAAAPCS
jgi:hypothetical protein